MLTAPLRVPLMFHNTFEAYALRGYPPFL